MALRAQSSYAPAHHRTDAEIAHDQHSTLNDLPIPSGSWQENYNRRNSKWNLILGVTATAFVASAVLLFNDLQFNAFSVADQKKTAINPK
jgi:hypothetical protein